MKRRTIGRKGNLDASARASDPLSSPLRLRPLVRDHQEIANYLGMDLGNRVIKKFADGEVYVAGCGGARVVTPQAISPAAGQQRRGYIRQLTPEGVLARPIALLPEWLQGLGNLQTALLSRTARTNPQHWIAVDAGPIDGP